ncbi:MAG TPA: MoaD/ThiS family protein [Candidatus Methylacidiphilales bacterium]|jgi:molybdopterin converting factor small subunit|nr:MoaD/ThiS family protein [Candidatus Methylacidiphilales bacterium]
MSNTSPAPLRVLILGPLREQLGCASATIAFPEDGTQASFWKVLGDKFPAALPKHLRLARENEFLDTDAPLRPGDELALIPPVSGG